MSAILSETDAGFAAQWHAWHDRCERERAAEHGFLAATSLRWLGPAPERFDDAPGAWSTGPGGPCVRLGAGERLELDGQAVAGTHGFGRVPELGGLVAYWDTPRERVALELGRRGGEDFLRPRHPENPTRLDYPGTPSFEPSLRFVVEGRFVPFERARPCDVGEFADGLAGIRVELGLIAFELDGPWELLAWADGGGGLVVLFGDRTNGITTAVAGRTLRLGAPDPAGRVRLDFNRALNLPSAYTAHAGCPLPPPGNRLAVAIEAGERMPASAHETDLGG